MSSIHNLKQIVDILYEEHKQFESKNGLTEIPRLKHQIQQLESQIQLKDKELSDLYTKNAELENIIRHYEYDFELLANLGAHPQPQQPQQPQETPSPPPTSTTQSPLPQEDKKEEHKENVVVQEEPQEDAKKPKKDRREYMKAYHREYRRKRREQKAVEMTV
jgi:hypothetical protein